ncbi:MAG: SCO family protein [Candidatus Acidiferrales bacterium]
MAFGKQNRVGRCGAPVALLLALGIAACPPARAQMQAAGVRPELLKDVGIDQKLGNQAPLNAEFRDEKGQTVPLGQYFHGKPVILALVYYQCPMLCTQVLDGMLHTFKELSWDAGKQFEVVTISIDPRDNVAESAAKQVMFAGLYGRPDAINGWHFLTGKDPAIHQLADAVGFRYAFDAQSGQYAHASTIVILTPEGKVSRYFYGISYPARDVRLGLLEASSGKIGTPIDQILLYCYHYDSSTGKYGLVVGNILKAGAAITVLVLGLGIFLLARTEHYSMPGKGA